MLKERTAQEMIENQFRLVMIDRMLKEKYNEIKYLAIQPPLDPNIIQIEKKDLEWLLGEHERVDQLNQEIAGWKQELEKQKLVYCDLQEEHNKVMNSLTWRIGKKITGVIDFLLAPVRKLRGKN